MVLEEIKEAMETIKNGEASTRHRITSEVVKKQSMVRNKHTGEKTG